MPTSRRRNPKHPQVSTPAFKRWFGKSKIVDADGNPQRLYHMTTGNFDVFRPGGNDPRISGRAIWLTPYPENIPAAHNVMDYVKGEGLVYRAGANIMPLWARIENPLYILDADDAQYAEQFRLDSFGFPATLSDKTIAAIKKAGYDGIVFAQWRSHEGYDLATGRGVEVIVFDPHQLKSATGNRGTFDPEDPSILRNPRRRGLDVRPGIPGTYRTEFTTKGGRKRAYPAQGGAAWDATLVRVANETTVASGRVYDTVKRAERAGRATVRGKRGAVEVLRVTNPARKAKPPMLAAAGLPEVWFHGTQKTFSKLKAQGGACVWLADKAGAMVYATPSYGRRSAIRLIEVTLAPDTRVVDLADASDPAVRSFIHLDASVSNMRWHGREDVTPAEMVDAVARWNARRTHYDAIEARPWAKAHFRKAGADALLVRDVAGWGGHEAMPSLCLLNAKKVVSERDAAPDLSLVRAEDMPKYENPRRRSAPQGGPMKTSQNGPDVTGRTPPSGLRIEFYDEQGDNDDRDERLAEAAWKIAHASPIRILSNKSLSAIAVLGRKVVGGGWYSVDMSHSDDEPSQFSFDIVVAHGAQGKGVGDALVKEMLDQFRQAAHGYDELVLNVEVVNPTMERILVRRGFRVRDEADPLAVRGRTMMTKNPRRRKNGVLGTLALGALAFAGGAYVEHERPFVEKAKERLRGPTKTAREQAARLQREVFTPAPAKRASAPAPAPAKRSTATDPAWRRERSPDGKGYAHLRTINGVEYEVFERIYSDGSKAIHLEAGDNRERILAPNGKEDGWTSVSAAKKAAEADAKKRKNPRRRK